MEASNEAETGVLVVQTLMPTEFVRISLPSLKRESSEPFPSTGSSRLAIQTTVGAEERVNHMEKQKALSPTGKKPAENSPFAETNASAGFSTDKDEALRMSSVLDEDREGVFRRHSRKRNRIEISIYGCAREVV